jgi:hypothetical protein
MKRNRATAGTLFGGCDAEDSDHLVAVARAVPLGPGATKNRAVVEAARVVLAGRQLAGRAHDGGADEGIVSITKETPRSGQPPGREEKPAKKQCEA